jgi:para-nitrobenzyl esterase
MDQRSLRTLSVGLCLLFSCFLVINCPAATAGLALSTGEPESRFEENTFFEECERSSPTIVCTRQGRIEGTMENGLLAFRNIPFAAPPVGNLRWRPPVPPAAWNGIRDGSTFGNICLQDDFAGGFTGSEDCLTLNVYTKNLMPGDKHPVMVFFHGGGFMVGSAQSPPYQTAPPLAERGVVVVTAQYRLGLMGFFAHPKLTAEGHGSSGNYALRDMIAALQWVRENICSFGGDPDRVMIFGESSGSIDVQFVLVSPLARGLFARAGMESSALIGGFVGKGIAHAYPLYAQLSPLLGCTTAADELDCLRATPASEIIDLQLHSGAFPFVFPNLDADVVPEDPFVALAERGSPVPLIIGSNKEEWAALGEDNGVPPLDEATYEAEIHAQFDPLEAGAGNHVLGFYPAAAYDNPRYAHIDVESDYWITCGTRDVARVAAGRHKVWRYLYTHRYENDAFLNSMRAFHGAELFLCSGTCHRSTTPKYRTRRPPMRWLLQTS